MKRSVLWLMAALAAGFLASPARAQYGSPPEPVPEPYKPEDSEPQGKKRADTTCPSIAVLADANRSTVFDGKGKDVTDIVYQAHLSNPVLDCRHKKGSQLNITVKVTVGAELGLAANTREIEIPYFVAIIDPEQMVVTKEKGVALVKIARDGRTGSLEVESPTIKLALEEDTVGADLEVLLGLQLDKDQLDYNRLSQ